MVDLKIAKMVSLEPAITGASLWKCFRFIYLFLAFRTSSVISESRPYPLYDFFCRCVFVYLHPLVPMRACALCSCRRFENQLCCGAFSGDD